jgi:hypothetical protein
MYKGDSAKMGSTVVRAAWVNRGIGPGMMGGMVVRAED